MKKRDLPFFWPWTHVVSAPFSLLPFHSFEYIYRRNINRRCVLTPFLSNVCWNWTRPAHTEKKIWSSSSNTKKKGKRRRKKVEEIRGTAHVIKHVCTQPSPDPLRIGITNGAGHRTDSMFLNVHSHTD